MMLMKIMLMYKLSMFQSGHPYYMANNGNNDRI